MLFLIVLPMGHACQHSIQFYINFNILMCAQNRHRLQLSQMKKVVTYQARAGLVSLPHPHLFKCFTVSLRNNIFGE